jgi:hypothetical protein
VVSDVDGNVFTNENWDNTTSILDIWRSEIEVVRNIWSNSSLISVNVLLVIDIVPVSCCLFKKFI